MKSDPGRFDAKAFITRKSRQEKAPLAALFYGSEEGLHTFFFQTLSLYAPLTRLTEPAFLEQPESFLTPDLFAAPGTLRGFYIEGVQDKNLKVYQKIFQQSLTDCFLILTSVKLRSASSFVQLFSRDPLLLAVPCYALSSAQMLPLVRQACEAFQLDLPEPLLPLLAASLAPENLLEGVKKLSLYAEPQTPLTADDVAACLELTPEKATELAYVLSAGNQQALPVFFNDQIEVEPIALVRHVGRHFMNLLCVRCALDRGENLDKAINTLLPSLFFKHVPLFKAHVQQWSVRQLYQALSLLEQAEVALKTAIPVCVYKIFFLRIASLIHTQKFF